MKQELDLIWVILAVVLVIATREIYRGIYFGIYRPLRYHLIRRRRAHRDRPVCILTGIDLTTGGLQYGRF